jgi:hypothetical protein
MQKPPSISEMIALARVLDKMNLQELRDEHKAVMLPFIAKTEKDRASLLVPGRFESFMDNARIIADEMCRHDIQMAAQAVAPIREDDATRPASVMALEAVTR